MTRKDLKRFPLYAAPLALSLVVSGALAHAQPPRNSARASAAPIPALTGEPGLHHPANQRVDDTQLKQVIVFSRHGVRSPAMSNSILDTFSVRPYPAFSSAPGHVTPNGANVEKILGGYYRLWLKKEGLLAGNDAADAASAYFRANVAEVTTKPTAQALAAGLFPLATVGISLHQPGVDPIFDPVGAGVARLNERTAVAAVMGRLGGDPQSLTYGYGPELALTRSVLFNYPVTRTPAPATPAGMIDVTAIPIEIIAGRPVNTGGMGRAVAAIDPFLMEYADGQPGADVAWGQLDAGGVSQTLRLYTLILDLEYRTPYLDKVQSSNAVSHVARTLVQAATGNAMTGALGNPSTRLIVLFASDVHVTGLAGLLHVDWDLPGYPTDFCGPGGAAVFQLRQSQSTGEYIVRTSYIAQTMDQLRNETALTLAAPPAIAPLFIPGCSVDNATFDCSLADFVTVTKHAVDPMSVDLTN